MSPVTHAERKQQKQDVYNSIADHILTVRRPLKINDLFDQFHSDIFSNVSYFVRSFVLLAEKDGRLHVKAAQRAGTWAAPRDVEFPSVVNKVTNKKKKLTTTNHLQNNKDDEPEQKASVPEKEEPTVDMSTNHEKSVPKPSTAELFGDDELDDTDEPEDDRFFTDEDGNEFEGKMTDIDPDNSEDWYRINKRLLTSKGYTDVSDLYKFDDDHTDEYVAVTIEGKVFHFTKAN